MARFWIGTSGWQYRHWRGSFYPPKLPVRLWFDHYVARFQTVEVNNSFYRLPPATTWDGWRERAPEGFRYAVKASRFLTHFKRFREPEEPLKRLFDGADRLKEHLGPVLYQAPPDFGRSPENVGRLEGFFRILPPTRQHVIEFRHDSWFGAETADLLRRHGVAFCSYDMPGLRCPLQSTAAFAYMRFHGPESRYAGGYSDALLKDWARRLEGLAREVDEVWVYFNNDIGGHAPRDAARLLELLEG